MISRRKKTYVRRRKRTSKYNDKSILNMDAITYVGRVRVNYYVPVIMSKKNDGIARKTKIIRRHNKSVTNASLNEASEVIKILRKARKQRYQPNAVQ